MLNIAAPAMIPPAVDPAPATMSASDAILIDAAESTTPAPSDIAAAIARCGSLTTNPSMVPPTTPDAAANPQQKDHATSKIPAVITSPHAMRTGGDRGGFAHWRHWPLGYDRSSPRKPESLLESCLGHFVSIGDTELFSSEGVIPGKRIGASKLRRSKSCCRRR